MKAFRICFPTAISSSALNLKKICSRRRNTFYVTDTVDQHNMSRTMLITMSSTMLTDISTRLRRRRDTWACCARTFSKAATVRLRSRGSSARPNRFGGNEGRALLRPERLQPRGMMRLVCRSFDFTNLSPILLLSRFQRARPSKFPFEIESLR